ncbi:DUF3087 family protein [Colwellia sp. MEBiC06753]
MKLIEINQQEYKKSLNVFSIAFVVTFALLSLIFGSVFIALFAEPITDPQTQSNFKYNVAGVVLALVTMAMIINSVKRHPYLTSVYFVWKLKQLQNRIYRKLVKIKQAHSEGDKNADIILAFYFQSLKYVYELDNNTLTISSVNQEIERLKQKLGEQQVHDSIEAFEPSMLDNY